MFDLAEYMAVRRATVVAALDAHMPGEETPPAVLHKAMRYSVFSGGKRLRPILCLAAAEAVNAPADRALYPAVAVELLHTYTLIHDDLPCMDDDKLRRGKPTSHVVFGEANAILAGDALQALAFEMAAGPEDAGLPSRQLVSELAHAAGSRGVAGGQVADLAAAESMTDEPTVGFIHLHKTADLFRAALRMGGLAGEASARELEALTEYGVQLGLAFQITDDLLDAPKDGGGDGGRAEGGASCVSLYGAEEARRKAETLAHQAIDAVRTLSSGDTRPLVETAIYVAKRTH